LGRSDVCPLQAPTREPKGERKREGKKNEKIVRRKREKEE
jgi:hypothetical protein